MPGPAKKPTNLKKLEGTYRKDRVAKNEMNPKHTSTMPPAPKYFNDRAKKVWFEVTEELSRLKMLHTVDLPSLTAYCYNVSLMEEAEEKLQKEGKLTTITNKGGYSYEIPSPWIKIHNDSLDKVIKISALFGFNPSARTRISMPDSKEDDKDPFEKLTSR